MHVFSFFLVRGGGLLYFTTIGVNFVVNYGQFNGHILFGVEERHVASAPNKMILSNGGNNRCLLFYLFCQLSSGFAVTAVTLGNCC